MSSERHEMQALTTLVRVQNRSGGAVFFPLERGAGRFLHDHRGGRAAPYLNTPLRAIPTQWDITVRLGGYRAGVRTIHAIPGGVTVERSIPAGCIGRGTLSEGLGGGFCAVLAVSLDVSPGEYEGRSIEHLQQHRVLRLPRRALGIHGAIGYRELVGLLAYAPVGVVAIDPAIEALGWEGAP